MKYEILSENIFVTGMWVSDVSVLLLLLLNIPGFKTSFCQKGLHNKYCVKYIHKLEILQIKKFNSNCHLLTTIGVTVYPFCSIDVTGGYYKNLINPHVKIVYFKVQFRIPFDRNLMCKTAIKILKRTMGLLLSCR
jgi:hypothetical protein